MDDAPVVLHDSDPLAPCYGDRGATICWFGSAEMMITTRSGKS